MAGLTTYLVDTSVWARVRRREVAGRLRPLLATSSVATCAAVDMEMLYSARNHDDHATVLRGRRSLRRLPITDATWDRAIEVQAALAKRGRHRGAPIPDLLAAAAAEMSGAAVLHYDADFDLIAEVTGQPVQWIVPRGSID